MGGAAADRRQRRSRKPDRSSGRNPARPAGSGASSAGGRWSNRPAAGGQQPATAAQPGGNRRRSANSGEQPGQPGGGTARSTRQPDQLADVVKDIWGHLPETLRQEMDHYYRDRFMPRYRDLLQEYYSRLAERDRTPPGGTLMTGILGRRAADSCFGGRDCDRRSARARPRVADRSEATARRRPRAKDMITPEAQRAIDRGLTYLARSQGDDGSWGDGPMYAGHVAIVAPRRTGVPGRRTSSGPRAVRQRRDAGAAVHA